MRLACKDQIPVSPFVIPQYLDEDEWKAQNLFINIDSNKRGTKTHYKTIQLAFSDILAT